MEELEKEVDLGWFTWQEAGTDLAMGREEGRSGLAMKCWGWTPRVQEIGLEFNNVLGGVREDLGCYIEAGEDVEEGRREPFDRFSDRDALLEHVSRELVDQLDKLVARLQKVVAVDNVHPGLLLFLARIYQALPRIAPAMRLCLDKKRSGKSGGGKGQVLSLKVEAKLGRESERLFLV